MLEKIVHHQDIQVIIAALFLTLFGQTITQCTKLTLNDFRRRSDGKLEARFAEDWMPIDKLTTKFLWQYVPDIGQPLFMESPPLLFTYSIPKMQQAVMKLVGVPLKPLRMTAIANIIRSGITDRGAITHLLGVSLKSVSYVEKAFQWDLQSTVPLDFAVSTNRRWPICAICRSIRAPKPAILDRPSIPVLTRFGPEPGRKRTHRYSYPRWLVCIQFLGNFDQFLDHLLSRQCPCPLGNSCFQLGREQGLLCGIFPAA